MPDDAAMGELAEKVEKLLYGIMNSMCYLINKICFAPNNTVPGGNDFDPQYAQQRLAVHTDRQWSMLKRGRPPTMIFFFFGYNSCPG